MSWLLLLLVVSAIVAATAIIVFGKQKKPNRIMQEDHTIVEQRWSYEDFCDVTIRLEDYTYALNRQVEVIALLRSFRPMPVDEFDRKARPLII